MNSSNLTRKLSKKLKINLLCYFCAMNIKFHTKQMVLFGFVFFMAWGVINAQQTTIGTLPSVINESSGLASYPENSAYFWSHNDSGGLPELYLFDINGELIHTLQITNFNNIDWEDLAQDNQGYLYIGDFGNNGNNRTNLKILKVPVNGLPAQAIAAAINFNYPDQTLFPPPPAAFNFDMEAMIYREDSLYLFSKNVLSFSAMGTGYSKLYSLPSVAGDYTANLIDSLYTFFQVTAADIAPSGKAVALLCYTRLYILHSFTGNNFFSGQQQLYQITPLFPPKQTEAVVFRDCSSVYITAETGELILYDFSADFPPPMVTVASDSITICAGQTADLFAYGGNSYEWQPALTLDNPASSNPVALPMTTTTYTVTSFNQIGCSNSKQVLVTVENCPDAIQTGVKLFLEGAYNTTWGVMNTTLNNAQLLPINQPFNRQPWNYSGGEGLVSPMVLPNNIVDWVLIEVRNAISGEVISKRAALLQSDGYLMDVAQLNSGEPKVLLYGLTPSTPYHISVKTRNHLPVMSALPVVLSDDIMIDFTLPENVWEGADQLKQIGNQYVLYAGDISEDGIISFTDFNKWFSNQPATSIYSDLDLNYDGMVDMSDYQIYRTNISRIGIPIIRD